MVLMAYCKAGLVLVVLMAYCKAGLVLVVLMTYCKAGMGFCDLNGIL